jgi:hypothetical protein
MRYVGHRACIGERRGTYRILVGILRERYNLGDLGIDGRLILKWIFKKWGGGLWTGLMWLMVGKSGGLL